MMRQHFDHASDQEPLLIPFEQTGLKWSQVVEDAYRVANHHALEMHPGDTDAARDLFRTRFLAVGLLLQEYSAPSGSGAAPATLSMSSTPDLVATGFLAEPIKGGQDLEGISGEFNSRIALNITDILCVSANYDRLEEDLPRAAIETKQITLANMIASLDQAQEDPSRSWKFDLSPENAREMVRIANLTRGRNEYEQSRLYRLETVFQNYFNDVSARQGLGLRLNRGPEGFALEEHAPGLQHVQKIFERVFNPHNRPPGRDPRPH